MMLLIPAPTVAGLIGACSTAVAVVMARAAAKDRTAGPRPRVLALACGIALTGVAAGASGLASLLAPDTLVADGVPLPTEIPLVCVFLVSGFYLAALLRPHQRRDTLGRLRVGFDVLGVTACLLFPCWLLMFSGGDNGPHGAAITGLIFGGGAAAATAVTSVHAIRHRAALQWCGPAATLSLVCLTAFVVAQDFHGVPNASIAALAAGCAMSVAAVLLWYGSVKISPDTGTVPPPGSEPSASFPLLTILIIGAALVAVYHLINGGGMDATSIALAAVALTTVVAREWVSAVALRRQAKSLMDQSNRLRGLMFGSTDVAMVLDSNLTVRWQSPAVARQFGLSDQEVLGRSVSALAHPDHIDTLHTYLLGQLRDARTEEAVPVRLRDGYGHWRDTEWSTSGTDPADAGQTLVVHVRDVTNIRDLEQTLRQVSYLDQGTGLANHDGLLRAADLITDAGATIVVELGGLTEITDVHGPEVAELVLVEAARRLRGQIAIADVPARLGETRLAVLTRCGAIRAHLLASQLVNALAAPYTAAGIVSHLSARAGLADVTGEQEPDEVIRRATLALRSVRSEPPGAVEWYDAEMESRLLRRSTLEQDLPEAIERAQIDLSYQPVLDLRDRTPIGVEAHLTWRHPKLGPVPAAELVAIAGDLGLLSPILALVLHRSCPLLVHWRKLHDDLWLSVNVRPRELVDPVFQASMHAALINTGLPHSSLVVEITEKHLLDVRDEPALDDVATRLGQLRAQGVRTAVGNFGTAPTSLSRLRILPVDLLKIDREVFGQPSGASPHLGAVMDVAVTLGRRLGMEVIAQDVESLADLGAVQAAGCRLGQGALLGRPMPAEHLEALLVAHHEA